MLVCQMMDFDSMGRAAAFTETTAALHDQQPPVAPFGRCQIEIVLGEPFVALGR